jgi:hypothetical protein
VLDEPTVQHFEATVNAMLGWPTDTETSWCCSRQTFGQTDRQARLGSVAGGVLQQAGRHSARQTGKHGWGVPLAVCCGLSGNCWCRSSSYVIIPGQTTTCRKFSGETLQLCSVTIEHVFTCIRHAVAQWLRHYATNRKVAVRFPMVSLECFIDIIILAALWPWG